MILFDGYLTQGGSYWEELGILWSVDRRRLKDFGVSVFNLRNVASEGWRERKFYLMSKLQKRHFVPPKNFKSIVFNSLRKVILLDG